MFGLPSINLAAIGAAILAAVVLIARTLSGQRKAGRNEEKIDAIRNEERKKQRAEKIIADTRAAAPGLPDDELLARLRKHGL